MLLKGAYCVGEHFVDPQLTHTKKLLNLLCIVCISNVVLVEAYVDLGGEVKMSKFNLFRPRSCCILN